ncbi:MAG: D-aminoacyl-tRNA deacylase [Tissierellia bacterium]|nr:D-aminoacyl-tRNA deacylase [Tissierellia bacterium]
MRAIVQKVQSASVSIDGKIHSQISEGLLVFLAVHQDDQDKDLDYIVDKIVNMRIFHDENNKMNKSILDQAGQILLVSQFTLYGDIRKGRRPSFTESAGHEKANFYYQELAKKLKDKVAIVKTGVFAADMKVALVNDGPVTIQLDSNKLY